MKEDVPPIFILSTRRSGTTLIQRILNSHEKITIWGEHGGFLKPISKAYAEFYDKPVMKNLVNSDRGAENLIGKLTVDKPIFWHNSLNEEVLKKSFKAFIKSLFTEKVPQEVRWGFKEVRYGINDNVMRLLSELFPKAQFVFIFRNPISMVESAIGAWNKNALQTKNEEIIVKQISFYKKLWLEQNQYLHQYYQDFLKGKVFYLSYEDLISEKRDIKSLCDFLQVDFSSELLLPLDKKFDSGRNNDSNLSFLSTVMKDISFEEELNFYEQLVPHSFKIL